MRTTVKNVQHKQAMKKGRRPPKRNRVQTTNKLDNLIFDSNFRKTETQLLAMKNHVAIGLNLVNTYSPPTFEFGGGISTTVMIPELQSFRRRVDTLLQSVFFNSAKFCDGHLRYDADLLLKCMNHFAGQILILPVSIECAKKDCRVIFAYGDKTTSIEGNQFNGKCSRILLDLHTDSTPGAWLLVKKRCMGVFLKEKIIGQWSDSSLSFEGGRLIFELIFYEKSSNQGSARVGSAKFQVEWFPKPKPIENRRSSCRFAP